MDLYQEVDNYYVYSHHDPHNSYRIVYVGMGRRDRAWQCRGSQRRPAHTQFLEDCLDNFGYTMNLLVKIQAAALTKKDALSIERELIKKHKPIYNLQMGVPKKLSEETICKARQDQKIGVSYSELGRKYKVSTMTIWRAING